MLPALLLMSLAISKKNGDWEAGECLLGYEGCGFFPPQHGTTNPCRVLHKQGISRQESPVWKLLFQTIGPFPSLFLASFKDIPEVSQVRKTCLRTLKFLSEVHGMPS